MSKLYDLQELVDHTGLPERTVRYYLAKVLEAPGGTRGRKAFYTQETLDQLKLAKQILMRTYNSKLGEVKPSLRDFQLWLKSQSAEEIHSMAEMPYRIKPKVLMAAAAPQASQTRNVKAHSVDMMELRKFSIDKEDSQNTRDSAAQYLDRVMGSKQKKSPDPKHRRQRQQQWESFRFGDNLNIRVRKPLTPAQERQLELAGQLLQTMLEKE